MATSQSSNSWILYGGTSSNGEIWHGRFLPVSQVDANYPGIPDRKAWLPYDEYLDTQDTPDYPVAIQFRDLCHDIDFDRARNIVSENCVRPGSDEFSWWSIATPHDASDKVKDMFTQYLDNPDEQESQFGSSQAFNYDSSLYGNQR